MLRRSSVHSRKSGRIMMMLPNPATRIYFTACDHLVSSSIQTLHPPSRSQRRRQSVRHDIAVNVFLLTTVFQGSQTVVCTSLRETLLDLNTCRISMEASVRAKASGPLARSVQGPSSSLVKGLAPPRGYQSPIMDGDPGALVTPRNRGQRSWVQIPPAPPR